MSESCPKIGDVPKSPFHAVAALVAVGRHNNTPNRDPPTPDPAWSMIAAHWSAIMTVPHYINEGKSDMRGIKPGWYAIEDDGNLSSGPFSSHEECVKRINQPTNETGASKLQRGPN